MNEQIRKFLNEEQDPKSIEKITNKLSDLLMKNEEVGYIGVQKKPVTIFPDSIVLTNKRIILCKPKNLGLSMDFTDYTWADVVGTFVKENLLGSEFSFSTKTDLTVSIDYLPKIQARKIYTFAKEQLDLLKNNVQGFAEKMVQAQIEEVTKDFINGNIQETIEDIETEEVTNFAEIIPIQQRDFENKNHFSNAENGMNEASTTELSQEALFEKLQNYKKLLDNGLILQGEYDALKKEILGKM